MSVDNWLFYIGIAFLILFFILRKKSAKSRILLVIGIILFFGPMVLPRQFFGSWNAIKVLGDKEISQIILQPSSPEWEVNLTDTTFTIVDKAEIDNLTGMLRKTEAYFANHPMTIWIEKMTLVTKDGTSLTLKIERTSNNGTVVTTPDNELRRDDLANVLERITNYKAPVKAKAK